MSEYDPPTDHVESGAEDAYLRERLAIVECLKGGPK